KNKSSDPTLVVGVERADFLVGPRVPDLHSSSHLPRDQVLAVGAERHGENLHAGREREAYSVGPGVPDLDGKRLPPVTRPTGGGDPLAGGVPGQTEDDTRVTGELEAHPAGPHVPDLHRCGSAKARRSNLLAVGADRQGPDFLVVIAE